MTMIPMLKGLTIVRMTTMSNIAHKGTGEVEVGVTFYTPQNECGTSVTVALTDTRELETFDDYVNMAKYIIISKYNLDKKTTRFSHCVVIMDRSMFFKPMKWNQLDTIDEEQDDHDS